MPKLHLRLLSQIRHISTAACVTKRTSSKASNMCITRCRQLVNDRYYRFLYWRGSALGGARTVDSVAHLITSRSEVGRRVRQQQTTVPEKR